MTHAKRMTGTTNSTQAYRYQESSFLEPNAIEAVCSQSKLLSRSPYKEKNLNKKFECLEKSSNKIK